MLPVHDAALAVAGAARTPCRRRALAAQAPPQSTSVSLPFFTASVQVGAWHSARPCTRRSGSRPRPRRACRSRTSGSDAAAVDVGLRLVLDAVGAGRRLADARRCRRRSRSRRRRCTLRSVSQRGQAARAAAVDVGLVAVLDAVRAGRRAGSAIRRRRRSGSRSRRARLAGTHVGAARAAAVDVGLGAVLHAVGARRRPGRCRWCRRARAVAPRRTHFLPSTQALQPQRAAAVDVGLGRRSCTPSVQRRGLAERRRCRRRSRNRRRRRTPCRRAGDAAAAAAVDVGLGAVLHAVGAAGGLADAAGADAVLAVGRRGARPCRSRSAPQRVAPPQSTSVSPPFLTASEQVGRRADAAPCTRRCRSRCRPCTPCRRAHGAAGAPPQSTSVSRLFMTLSEQLAAWHSRPCTQLALAQSAPPRTSWRPRTAGTSRRRSRRRSRCRSG